MGLGPQTEGKAKSEGKACGCKGMSPGHGSAPGTVDPRAPRHGRPVLCTLPVHAHSIAPARVVRREYKECAGHFPRGRGGILVFLRASFILRPLEQRTPLMHVLDEFKWRGLVTSRSPWEALQTQFASPGQTVYCGFDQGGQPSYRQSRSLARPSPIPARGTSSHRPGWRGYGAHRGSSFKANERSLNEADVVAGWVESSEQMAAFHCSSIGGAGLPGE